MRGTFRELANAGEIPEPHTPFIPSRCTVPMASCDLGRCPDGFRIKLRSANAATEMLADPEMTIKEVAGVNRATIYRSLGLGSLRQRSFEPVR